MYDFGEKKQEKNKAGQMVDVWVLPKYDQSKRKAIEVIEKFDGIEESDFWILKNETKTGTIMYSGLIISHTGCLKINECLDEKMRFRPECLTEDKEGYGGSLVYKYCCPEQGIFEVGEVSAKNCKIAYPYAMAFKRCYDRVVLKASKLAFSGIYSESESDGFADTSTPAESKTSGNVGKIAQNVGEIAQAVVNDLQKQIKKPHVSVIREMIKETNTEESDVLKYYDLDKIESMTEAQYGDCLQMLKKKKEKKNRKVIGGEK